MKTGYFVKFCKSTPMRKLAVKAEIHLVLQPFHCLPGLYVLGTDTRLAPTILSRHSSESVAVYDAFQVPTGNSDSRRLPGRGCAIPSHLN